MRHATANLDTEELMHLALHATENDQPEQAIDYLKRLLEISQDNGKAYYLLGAVHAEIGLYDRAVEEMAKAVELEPNLPTAHFQLGLLHVTSGRVDAAEQSWRPLDALGENEPLFLFKRGMLHLVHDRFEACIEDLRRGIALNTLNEALNNDMRNIIARAETARLNLPGSAVESDAPRPASGSGHHVLLSAYHRDDDTEH
jgi:Flp pilus assembly protein TadD